MYIPRAANTRLFWISVLIIGLILLGIIFNVSYLGTYPMTHVHGSQNLDTKVAPAEYADKEHSGGCPCPMPLFEDTVEQQFTHIISKYPNITRAWSYLPTRPMSVRAAYAMERQSLNQKQNVMEVDVTVMGQCTCGGLPYQKLRITEKHTGDTENTGGSGYFVTSHSYYLNVCPVVDHFDGTYSVFCLLYSPCTNISVLLKHIRFSAFKGFTEIFEKPVWSAANICLKTFPRVLLPTFEEANKQPMINTISEKISKLPVPRGELTGEHGHWRKVPGDDFSWMGEDGTVFPLHENKTMCNCLNKFSSVFMLGASHLQFNHKCLLGLCGGDLPIYFDLNRWIKPMQSSLSDLFDRLASQPVQNKPVLVLVQFGSWDLSQSATEDIVLSYIPQFKQFLVDSFMSRKSSMPNARLVVMSLPSFPEYDSEGGHRVTRNNWMSAVFTNALKRNMQDIGVEFINAYRFTLPLYWYTWRWPLPDDHYQFWLPKVQQCAGHVGKVHLNWLISTLCPDTPMY